MIVTKIAHVIFFVVLAFAFWKCSEDERKFKANIKQLQICQSLCVDKEFIFDTENNKCTCK